MILPRKKGNCNTPNYGIPPVQLRNSPPPGRSRTQAVAHSAGSQAVARRAGAQVVARRAGSQVVTDLVCNRFFPDPLGIVLRCDKLEFN